MQLPITPRSWPSCKGETGMSGEAFIKWKKKLVKKKGGLVSITVDLTAKSIPTVAYSSLLASKGLIILTTCTLPLPPLITTLLLLVILMSLEPGKLLHHPFLLFLLFLPLHPSLPKLSSPPLSPNFQSLPILIFASAGFSGQIPLEISSLTRLVFLDLSHSTA